MWDAECISDIEEFEGEPPPSLPEHNAGNSQSIPKSLYTWIIVFLSHFQVMFYLSDKAMDILLKFISAFLLVLGSFSNVCHELASTFPRSVYRLRTFTGVNSLLAVKYVVCRKCASIYRYEDCTSSHSSKVCSYRKFPNHRYRRHRQECGSLLLKTVELSTGRKILYPFLAYCYLGLQCGMQRFLLKPDFVSLSEPVPINRKQY